MGNGYTKENENIYFKCRKEAAICNPGLCSRESAADLLGVSVSSLADYELGLTKVVPADKVVLMSNLYGTPELEARYCKFDCPIGESMPVATEVKDLKEVTLSLLYLLDADKLDTAKKSLLDAAVAGLTKEKANALDEVLSYF